ncbi:pyruvate flavodoxin/ferredoxin oxidoreductase domain protein [Hydrogenobacter thermophilus TK-6]|uniref:Pyruvate:ferredoxin oxidoreductase alpha subunit n=2 Tax=Hydrogenobacter thermophilus TaxID=940 RepID=D3DJK0_HYDTT|nr:transketolase C-terminal domain-containing protein [Hydrogenobacter thermophilus]ADO45925.1 pyruvate flavodoxin/ferredoxin oxidoreductase domain protein [Hydrogenobacter thermophilus TK-6]BAA95605.1 pyruvate:ferredoxin oxidoreductase alpha subunit [Hydrogenobacter thermophilus TK-6]BAI70002.1 pyruvate:ferredoxin oxidoreductase alpha subunit [Hydrogenobacter thermophilus TK-6]
MQATESILYNRAGQKVVSPDYLLFEAPRTKHFMTGSEAVKEAVKRASVDASVSYPITPQSEAAHLIGELWVEGYVGVYFRGESEFGVMSEIAGCALAGARTITTTSGPGTLRAMENFPMWAGTRIPVQLVLMARGVNAPLSIQPDNLEVSFLLDTGCMIWYAETAQDLFDMILAGFVVAEQPDVHVPVITVVDGFFVSHTRETVMLPPDDIALPPYNPYRAPMPVIDAEVPPGRFLRDPFVMKSNYISYATHASWQWEVRAAIERSRPYAKHYLRGLIEHFGDPEADLVFVACGTASAQAKEAVRMLEDEGISARVVKLKTIRPFPIEELREATKGAKYIFVPEFNVVGWLEREVRRYLYGHSSAEIIGAPRVAGGMTMPAEVIVREVLKLTGKEVKHVI